MHRILGAISLVFVLGSCVLAQAAERSLIPQARPDGMASAGALCGSGAIQGNPIAPIEGRIAGCGIAEPVAVTAVLGIPLSRPARMDCPTALALRDWTQAGVIDTVGSYRGGVAELQVVGEYACRARNNRAGAKISEHGKGRAIDIAGFTMVDGSTITLLDDWDKGRAGRLLRQMHEKACGIFGTVLGPESDVYHQDHFHFDTASYRGGAYCR